MCVCVCVCVCVCTRALSHVQLFCDPMDYSLADSSVHGILQAWSEKPFLSPFLSATLQADS